MLSVEESEAQKLWVTQSRREEGTHFQVIPPGIQPVLTEKVREKSPPASGSGRRR